MLSYVRFIRGFDVARPIGRRQADSPEFSQFVKSFEVARLAAVFLKPIKELIFCCGPLETGTLRLRQSPFLARDVNRAD